MRNSKFATVNRLNVLAEQGDDGDNVESVEPITSSKPVLPRQFQRPFDLLSLDYVAHKRPVRYKARVDDDGFLTKEPQWAPLPPPRTPWLEQYIRLAFLRSPNREFAQDFCTLLCDGNEHHNTTYIPKSEHASDIILDIALPIVNKLNISMFNYFVAPLRVRPIAGTLPVMRGTESTVKMYTFFSSTFPGRTVPLKLPRGYVVLARVAR